MQLIVSSIRLNDSFKCDMLFGISLHVNLNKIIYLVRIFKLTMLKKIFFLISVSLFGAVSAQVPIDLFQQFNGKYNHTAIGNTLNIHDNSLPVANGFCDVLDTSSATLTLGPGQNLIAAYLYWSGPVNTQAPVGDQIDDAVTLNGVDFVADDTFVYTLTPVHQYFASYVDVTDLAIATGSGTYDFTNLDLSFLLTSPYHCSSNGGNQTNYGGWAVSFIYEDLSLPYFQISIFHGLDGVSRNNNFIDIHLTNLNVIDDVGAKIHFLAWEGDERLAVGESLFINGNQISNAPLNPANNAFNGTNSYTNSSNLNNMDLDFYNIQNNIAPGDTAALIEIRSLADLVMINNVITVLNSQLPDATVIIDDYIHSCDNETIHLEYTVSNTNSTDFLPANTPIAFYANGVLIANAVTQNDIPIGGSESATIDITLPNNIPNTFTLIVVADDDGTGTGSWIETDETNNSTTQAINLLVSPVTPLLPDIQACDVGGNSAFYDLTQQEALLNIAINSATYYETFDDASAQINEILNPGNYQNLSSPQTIFIRVENNDCFQIISFDLTIKNCLPIIIITGNGVSPNGDGLNDTLVIEGVTNIFEHHELKIFNRYGTLIFEGGYENPWDGKSNRGINNVGDLLPVATYYYVIDLKDENYPDKLTGWVYLNY